MTSPLPDLSDDFLSEEDLADVRQAAAARLRLVDEPINEFRTEAELTAASRRVSHGVAWIAVISGILVGAAVMKMLILSPAEATAPASAPIVEPSSPPPPESLRQAQVTVPASPAIAASTPEPRAVAGRPAPARLAEVRDAPTIDQPRTVVATVANVADAPVVTQAVAPAPLPLPADVPAAAVLPAVVAAADFVEAPPLRAPTPAPALAPVSPAEPARASASTSANMTPVRDVLARYRAAYDRLDARSAKAIWPTVDERALARAFDALDSQKVTFDACDVAVTDGRAVASCRGTATYITRMGNRSVYTSGRQWNFVLQRSADQWLIESVQTR